jgi:hypothetical protein
MKKKKQIKKTNRAILNEKETKKGDKYAIITKG